MQLPSLMYIRTYLHIHKIRSNATLHGLCDVEMVMNNYNRVLYGHVTSIRLSVLSVSDRTAFRGSVTRHGVSECLTRRWSFIYLGECITKRLVAAMDVKKCSLSQPSRLCASSIPYINSLTHRLLNQMRSCDCVRNVMRKRSVLFCIRSRQISTHVFQRIL